LDLYIPLRTPHKSHIDLVKGKKPFKSSLKKSVLMIEGETIFARHAAYAFQLKD